MQQTRRVTSTQRAVPFGPRPSLGWVPQPPGFERRQTPDLGSFPYRSSVEAESYITVLFVMVFFKLMMDFYGAGRFLMVSSNLHNHGRQCISADWRCQAVGIRDRKRYVSQRDTTANSNNPALFMLLLAWWFSLAWSRNSRWNCFTVGPFFTWAMLKFASLVVKVS